MPHAVIMPMLGMAQDSGILVRWLVTQGEWVEQGQPLMEIETDKVTVEIESPASGLLVAVQAAEGDSVPVGQTIAYLIARDEKTPEIAASVEEAAQPLEQRTGAESKKRISPVARAVAASHGIDPAEVVSESESVRKEDVLAHLRRRESESGQLEATSVNHIRIPASPLARRLADEQGVDLREISGSGPQGAVLAGDVNAAVAKRQAELTTSLQPPPTGSGGEDGVSSAWQVMVSRLTQGWQQSPHFYLTSEVRASGLVEWRNGIQKRTGRSITYTDLIIRIVAAALRQHPQINSSWQQGNRRANRDINVGIAVSTKSALYVPVIHNADHLGVGEIATERERLVESARAGTLQQADMLGGTFTISNLGMYGIDAFSAVVNPGQAAILAVGRIADRVLAIDGCAVVAPCMVLTLSCDHRVTDGANAASFLKLLTSLLEEPRALLD